MRIINNMGPKTLNLRIVFRDNVQGDSQPLGHICVMFENLSFAPGLPYLEIIKWLSKDSIFPGNAKWHTNCNRLCSSIKNADFKEFWILILQHNNSLRAPWKRYAKIESKSKRGSKES